jgi:hypothetical protein
MMGFGIHLPHVASVCTTATSWSGVTRPGVVDELRRFAEGVGTEL